MGARGTFQQSSRYKILVSSDLIWIHRISVAEDVTCTYVSTHRIQMQREWLQKIFEFENLDMVQHDVRLLDGPRIY